MQNTENEEDVKQKSCCDTFHEEYLNPVYSHPDDDLSKMENNWPKIILCGFQHMASVVFTVTLVPIYTMGYWGLDMDTQRFVISQSIFMSGVSTLIQSYKIGPIGSNLLSVMGCSFAFLDASKACGSLKNVFGVSMATAFFEPLIIYLIPQKVMQTIFPPYILGISIILIGFGLCGVGIQDWDGKGSTAEVGIGAFSFASLMAVYRFGTPLMRNMSVLIALISGYIFAALLGKVDTQVIDDADWFIFPEPLKYGIGIKGATVVPFLIATFISTLESIGDITATTSLSGKRTHGVEFQRRVRGGLNADAVGSFLSSLFCSFPNTTYSENNGLIAITGVSDYRVGLVFGCLMMVLGLFGKFAGLFLSIPKAVFGGILTVLFSMIAVSGFKFLIDDLKDRKVQLITAASLGIGIGVSIRYNNGTGASVGTKEITDTSARIILDSGLTMGVLTAIFLNLALTGVDLGQEEMSLKAEKERRQSQSNLQITEAALENEQNLHTTEQQESDIVEMGDMKRGPAPTEAVYGLVEE